MTTSTRIRSEVSTTPDRTAVGGLGALGAAGGLALAAGPLGGGAGLAVLALWALTPGVFVAGLAGVLLAALAPDAGLPALTLVVAGSIVVLAGSIRDDRVPTLVATGVGTLVLAGLVRSADGWADGLWPAALALLGIVAVAAYGGHRYELVRLGLVEGEA